MHHTKNVFAAIAVGAAIALIVYLMLVIFMPIPSASYRAAPTQTALGD
jgi:membrane protein insertase Oxa1/YidC/SpoIIIJ